MMGYKLFLVWIAILLLLALPIAAGFSDVEDFARVKASVVGFKNDTSGASFITIRVDDISDYNRTAEADYPPLRVNMTLTLGYLWGHRPVNGTFPRIDIGSEIVANISLHHAFTSHVGHLYWYKLVCGESEVLMDGRCVPIECAADEMRVGGNCVLLNCGPEQGYRNHTCYDLECNSDEQIEDHHCVGLVCADDEFASNSLCQKLDCGFNKVAKNHECVSLICGVFKRVGNHTCVLDWGQLAIFVIVIFIILYLIYALLIQDLFSEKKKGERALANRIGIILVSLVSLAVLVLPAVSRWIFHSSLLIGSDSYHTQLISREVMEGTLKFSLGGQVTIYHLLMAYLGSVFGLDSVARILPILLGTLSATIFYLIMRKIIDDVRTSTLTTMVLIFSPAFLYLFGTSTPNCLVVLLMLVAVFLALSSRRLSVLSSGILLALVSTFDPFVFALSFAAYLLMLINTRNNRSLRLVLLGLIALAGLSFSIFFHSYSQPIISFRSDLLRESITDFGGTIGFGIFHLILLLSGLLYTWEKKRYYAPIYLMVGLLFALAIALNSNYNAYLNFVVVYFIGLALSRFGESKWEAQQLKSIALLILFCGMLFSTVSYAKRMSLMEPDPSLVEALTRLSNYSEGNVLSHYTYSDFIEYSAKMPAYMEPGTRDAVWRLNISNEIFYSRRLDYTKQLLDAGNISYIVVDRNMRQGLVWDRDDQGLLFLFTNNESFRRLFGEEVNVEVWEYLPPNANLTAR